MNHTIHCVNWKGELAWLLRLEYEDMNQPDVAKAPPERSNKKRIGLRHLPDYFVLRRKGVAWIECKQKENIFILTEQD